MYATFEQPDQKATFQLTVLAPAHWSVFTNSRYVFSKISRSKISLKDSPIRAVSVPGNEF